MILSKAVLKDCFDFKQRQKNKVKFMASDDYGIKLYNVGNHLNSFVDSEDNKYESASDVSRKIFEIRLNSISEMIKNGSIPEQCLNQCPGGFDSVFVNSKKSDDEWFIKHDRAKVISRMFFNLSISSNLMNSNSEPNYKYRITKIWYDMVTEYKDFQILRCYMTLSEGRNHTFTMSNEICSYAGGNYQLAYDAKYPVDKMIEALIIT